MENLNAPKVEKIKLAGTHLAVFLAGAVAAAGISEYRKDSPTYDQGSEAATYSDSYELRSDPEVAEVLKNLDSKIGGTFVATAEQIAVIDQAIDDFVAKHPKVEIDDTYTPSPYLRLSIETFTTQMNPQLFGLFVNRLADKQREKEARNGS